MFKVNDKDTRKGWFLDIYCVWLPHAMPFLVFFKHFHPPKTWNFFNPLSTNLQNGQTHSPAFVDELLSVSDHFVGLAFNRLREFSSSGFQLPKISLFPMQSDIKSWF